MLNCPKCNKPLSRIKEAGPLGPIYKSSCCSMTFGTYEFEPAGPVKALDISDEEIQRLNRMVEDARKRPRPKKISAEKHINKLKSAHKALAEISFKVGDGAGPTK